MVLVQLFPLQVSKHLSKLFDNMAKLKFSTDDEGEPIKEGLGMYSKEGEYVAFGDVCSCTGQVLQIVSVKKFRLVQYLLSIYIIQFAIFYKCLF